MRKLGPLPIWAWAAVAVGGFLVYRYVQNRQAAANQMPTTSVGPDYGPAGWPGQGAISPTTIPMSAISQVAGGFNSATPTSSSGSGSTPATGGRTTLQMFNPGQANSSGSPPAFFPR